MLEQLAAPQRTLPELTTHAPLLSPRRPVQRILLPTDFSDLSLEPLGLAAEIAKASGAEIHFLFVDVLGAKQPEHQNFPDSNGVETAWWRAAPNRLHRIAEANAFRPAIVTAIERSVDVAPTISAYATDHKIDLIVMATSAQKGVSRLFLGSVTEEVVRHAPCSVLVAHRGALERPMSEPPRILSAIDFSPTSLEAARLTSELCRNLEAEHLLVHAVGQPQTPAFYGMEYSMPPAMLDEIVDRSRSELEKLLNNDLGNADILVRTGSPVREILGVIEASAIDLLVVGSHGLSGLPLFLLGSVAERLARLSPVPVLVVRPAGSSTEAKT